MNDTGQPERDGTVPGGRRIGGFLLDDDEIVRRGGRGLLRAEPDITVVGEAGRKVMGGMRDEGGRVGPLAALTAEERRILELIGEGLTNRQIGERMFLAEKTVKNYVSALFAKLGMERRTQAAAYAAKVFEDEDQPERKSPAG